MVNGLLWVIYDRTLSSYSVIILQNKPFGHVLNLVGIYITTNSHGGLWGNNFNIPRWYVRESSTYWW